MDGEVFDWFPRDLAHVAIRLARAEELQLQLGRACLDWPANALELKQTRRDDGFLDVVVQRVRPTPPIVKMLFSEIVHHLRAAIDNVVFYMTETMRGDPLPDDAAQLVAMPIVPSAEKLRAWSDRRSAKVPELGSDTGLYRRIESQQPYRSLAVVTALSPDFERFVGPTELHGVQPLVLLQGYSNTDKHRAVRVAAGRTLEGTNLPLAQRIQAGMNWRPLQAGDMVVERVSPGGALARTGRCWPLRHSEPPASVGLACRPVGAWRRHLMKQLDSTGRLALAHCHRRWTRGLLGRAERCGTFACTWSSARTGPAWPVVTAVRCSIATDRSYSADLPRGGCRDDAAPA
jgi:hypothetical protein